MKQIALLLIGLLSSLFVMAQSQEFQFAQRVLYRMTAQTDSTDSESITELDWYLFVNPSESLFQEVKLYQTDSNLYFHDRARANRLVSSGLPVRLVPKFRYKVVKNNTQIIFFDEVIGIQISGHRPLFKYEEPRDDMEWVLSSDTVHIAGLVCQKAKTTWGGRDWIAYFAPDIPISDGPFKFCGLPGLIVSIKDSEGYWKFEMKGMENLNPHREVVINFQKYFVPQTGTKAEFFKLRKEYQDNLLNAVSAMVPEGLPEATRTGYSQRLQADNNWIELP